MTGGGAPVRLKKIRDMLFSDLLRGEEGLLQDKHKKQ